MKKITLATLLCMAWIGEAQNGNVVIGNGNYVRGNDNYARGNRNVQHGDRNEIIGSNNFNQGNDRQIIGDNHYVSSQHPEYEKYRDSSDDYGSDHLHQAGFELSGTVGQTRAFGNHLTSQPIEQIQNSVPPVNAGAQVLNGLTPQFMEGKRMEIISELQHRLQGIRH